MALVVVGEQEEGRAFPVMLPKINTPRDVAGDRTGPRPRLAGVSAIAGGSGDPP